MVHTQAPFTLIRRCEACKAVGVSAPSLYRLIAKGQFPKPIKISAKLVGWLESDINAWLEARIAQRDGGVK